ncbi:MAG: DUF4390 domain-containing protein [Candidatus Marinimicrobia bacterium]|nr:DUF4390 domain-containing protein [Candidatus Neomarinimicrobiota bacterium]MCF7851111.1 DUF4390 domain-containing protein [Candidatus Neomarinimicrobiota bacterium]MCF7904341.1 DUF4390 domain-containing protein [Candidatus Neomarinimicrobiota bacterium]
MFEFLSQTFNASVLAVTQLFLSTVVSSNPWFEQLDIQYFGVKKQIVCNTRLTESFTESLDNVLLSGKSITLHFKFDLMSTDSPNPIQSTEVINGLRYDSEQETFFLVNSVNPKVDRFFSIEEARSNYVSVQNLVVASTEDLGGEQEYFLRVTAFLDPVKMDDMGESVNLMLRWASIKPSIMSDKFRIEATST